MKNKLLPIVFVVMLLLTVGFATAAYDLAIAETGIVPANPVEGVSVEFSATISNLGPDNFTSSDNAKIQFTYGTGDQDILDINDTIAIGDQIIYQTNYTYTSAGTYPVLVELVSMNNDSTSTNNNDSFTIVVAEQEINVSLLDYNISALRGASVSSTKAVTNSGNVDTDVIFHKGIFTNEANTDALSSSEVILSLANATIPADDSVDLEVTAEPSVTRLPGTYTGIVSVELANGTVLDTSTVTIVVQNNAPTITAINDQTVVEGNEFTYQVVANDIEGEALNYHISGPSDMLISNTGLISGWTATGIQTANVVVTVGDGYDNSTESFQIEVLQNIPQIEIIGDEILVGGSEQERGEQISTVVTIKNTGTQTLSNLSAHLSGTSSTTSTMATKYAASVSIADTILAPGASTTASIILTVPENQDSREESIGRLVVNANGDDNAVTDNDYIKMQAKSYLKISDVRVEVGNDDKKLSDGDTFNENDLQEGATVTVTLTLDNLYTESDYDIENTYFEIESDESDWNIDEKSTKKDIREDHSKDIQVSFVIGSDLDEENTDVVIRAYGDDRQNYFEHYDEWTISFEIQKENDEVSIKSWTWTNEPITCDDNYANLRVTIKNTGTDDQDEVMLEVASEKSELGYAKRIRDISLDSDDSKVETFQIPIKDIKEGSYFLTLRTYYNTDEKSDEEVINLDVGSCIDTSPKGNDDSSGTKDNGGTTVITTPPTLPNTGATPIYGQPVNKIEQFTSSIWYIILLIIVVVLLLIIVITMAVRLASK